MEPRTSLLPRFHKCRLPPAAGEDVATSTVHTPLQRASSSAQRSLSEVPASEGMEISDRCPVPCGGMLCNGASPCSNFAPVERALGRSGQGEEGVASPPSPVLASRMEISDECAVPCRGMLYNDASPCSNFAPVERALGRIGQGEEGVASPPSPVLASRPRKFRLVEEERAKQPGVLDLDGRAVVVKNTSPRCEGSAVQVLAKSLPSPSFAEPSEQTLGDGELLSTTSPDRVFSCFRDLPPMPGAPKKSCTLRSAPLRKTQPRRLQFGDEGEDVPLVACSSHTLASSPMRGVGSISPRFSEPSYVGDGCREFAPPDDNGGEPDDLGMREELSPRTPPDKVFNGFAPGDTPTAPRCLRKSLRGSTLKRDWR